MNTFKNVRILNYCFTCHEPYDRTHADPNEKGVKCTKCDGFIVSPSGKVQMEIVPAVKCYLFQDGENHWLAANSLEDAERYFVHDYADEECDYTAREVPPLEQREIVISGESPNEKNSLFNILCSLDERIPTVVASSVW